MHIFKNVHAMCFGQAPTYLLSCSIYDNPVSFLIDTGAGASLLSKSVWDKIKPAKEKFNPVTIKVEGMVSSHFS